MMSCGEYSTETTGSSSDHKSVSPFKVSLFEKDEFFKKFITKESSVGFSYRMYYRDAEGIPFQWEMLPGKPKNARVDELIPPLSPPPAVQSLGLPRPNIAQIQSLTRRNKSWFFWKKRKKHQQCKRLESSNYEHGKFTTSDGDFKESPRLSYSSSVSQSSSFNEFTLKSARDKTPACDLIHGLFSCRPWNIARILVSGVKRAWHTCSAICV